VIGYVIVFFQFRLHPFGAPEVAAYLDAMDAQRHRFNINPADARDALANG